MLLRVLVLMAIVTGTALTACAETITYNFDDGTDQGWTNVLTSPGDEPTSYGASDRSDAALFPSHSGNFRVLPTISGGFSPTEDSPHSTLVFRSPEFVPQSGASIRFFLGIGTGGAASPGADFNSLATSSATNGFLGVAVRRVSDNAYVLIARRAGKRAQFLLRIDQMLLELTHQKIHRLFVQPMDPLATSVSHAVGLDTKRAMIQVRRINTNPKLGLHIQPVVIIRNIALSG